MYTTSITTQHTFKTKDSSWELSERISKYLKSVSKGHWQVSVDCGSDGIIVTVLNTIIPIVALKYIDENISDWVKEIKEAEKKQSKEDMVEVREFLKEFKVPTALKGKHLSVRDALLDVIKSYLDDLNDGFKSGEPNVCTINDIVGLTEIFHLLGAGKYKEAYNFTRSLDTCVREVIPDSVYELIQSGAWVK